MRSLGFLTAIVTVSAASLGFAQTNYVQPSGSMAQPPAANAPVAMQPAPAVYHAPIDSVGDGAIPALPLDVLTSNGVTYINGGIGDEEIAELKAKSKEFNLQVLLSAPKGEFISGVTLNILDSTGAQLVSISDAGPYVYAKLPAGTYTLEATDVGNAVKKIKFTLKNGVTVKKQMTFGEAG